MAGFLERAGRDVPVFEGSIPPATVVPHNRHLQDHVLDLYQDNRAERPLAGNIDDALEYLDSLDGHIHVIAGGPLTDVRKLMERPGLNNKLGMLATQLGLWGWGGDKAARVNAGGRRQFNYACDSESANRVLKQWPDEQFVVSSDITKHPEVTLPSLEALEELELHAELTEVYRRVHPTMMAPHGGEVHIHDLHPVVLMSHMLEDNAHSSEGHSTDYAWWVGDYAVARCDQDSLRPSASDERSGELDFVSPHTPADSTSRLHVVSSVVGTLNCSQESMDEKQSRPGRLRGDYKMTLRETLS
ncbi:MAG TPA: nucleoside hydrolase [Candidatus Limnocylindrales bacterium]|nr:nucleoside hydrolase [Candidatus Limnocylindrales bacterium]